MYAMQLCYAYCMKCREVGSSRAAGRHSCGGYDGRSDAWLRVKGGRRELPWGGENVEEEEEAQVG